MTTSQSTPGHGPVTVEDLAQELGVLPDWVEDHARSLEAQHPRIPAVYLVRRDRLLSGEAADAIRELYTGAEQSPDITVGDLARELGATHYVVQVHAAKQGPESEVYRTRSLFRGDNVLSGAAADGIRRSLRAERADRMSADATVPETDPGRRAARRMLAGATAPEEQQATARRLYQDGIVPAHSPVPQAVAHDAEPRPAPGGPVRVVELARELGVQASEVAREARALEQGPGDSVYTSDGRLRAVAAGAVRLALGVPDVSAEDLEVLRLPNQGYGQCSRTDRHPAHLAVNGREHQSRYTCLGLPDPDPYWAQSVYGGYDYVNGGVSGTLVSDMVELQRRTELLTKAFSDFVQRTLDRLRGPASPDPVRVSAEPLFWGTLSGRGLEDIASLLLRQDMRNADPVEIRGESDQQVMDWALATAGHLFDQHVLWDYDLVPDAEHVHRCIGHRHHGPGTRLGADPRG